jgi:hypothetical protein
MRPQHEIRFTRRAKSINRGHDCAGTVAIEQNNQGSCPRRSHGNLLHEIVREGNLAKN